MSKPLLMRSGPKGSRLPRSFSPTLPTLPLACLGLLAGPISNAFAESSAAVYEHVREVVLAERRLREKPTPVPTPPPMLAQRPTPVPRVRLPAGWEFAEPKNPTPTPVPETVAETRREAGPDAVQLDKFVVTGKRDPFYQQKMAELQLRREHVTAEIEAIENSPLDQVLNAPQISFLGPYSSGNRLAIAQAKLSAMDFEEFLIAAIEASTDPLERAQLKRFLFEVRYGVRMSK